MSKIEEQEFHGKGTLMSQPCQVMFQSGSEKISSAGVCVRERERKREGEREREKNR